MVVVIRIISGVLLLAHGLVHLLYLATDVREFSLQESWLVPEAARRPVAIALMLATVGAFGLLALAVWDVPGLSGMWPALTITAATLSLALLIAFWNPRLLFGVTIDLVLIAIAALRPGWAVEVLA